MYRTMRAYIGRLPPLPAGWSGGGLLYDMTYPCIGPRGHISGDSLPSLLVGQAVGCYTIWLTHVSDQDIYRATPSPPCWSGGGLLYDMTYPCIGPGGHISGDSLPSLLVRRWVVIRYDLPMYRTRRAYIGRLPPLPAGWSGGGLLYDMTYPCIRPGGHISGDSLPSLQVGQAVGCYTIWLTHVSDQEGIYRATPSPPCRLVRRWVVIRYDLPMYQTRRAYIGRLPPPPPLLVGQAVGCYTIWLTHVSDQGAYIGRLPPLPAGQAVGCYTIWLTHVSDQEGIYRATPSPPCRLVRRWVVIRYDLPMYRTRRAYIGRLPPLPAGQAVGCYTIWLTHVSDQEGIYRATPSPPCWLVRRWVVIRYDLPMYQTRRAYIGRLPPLPAGWSGGGLLYDMTYPCIRPGGHISGDSLPSLLVVEVRRWVVIQEHFGTILVDGRRSEHQLHLVAEILSIVYPWLVH